MRHKSAGGCTDKDRPPMAGGVTHPERERIMDSSSAWHFNFNNGERNWNNRNNSNNKRVFAVRPLPRR